MLENAIFDVFRFPLSLIVNILFSREAKGELKLKVPKNLIFSVFEPLEFPRYKIFDSH